MTRLLPGVISSSGAVSAYSVVGSLRFNYSDSNYLVRVPTTSGNRKTWTWSTWVKLSNIQNDINGVTPLFAQHYAGGTGSRDYIQLYENKIWIDFNNGTSGIFRSTRLLRDPSAWYHLVFAVDTTQPTDSNRVKFYVNGEQVVWSTATYPTQNYDTAINLSNTQIRIGGQTDGVYYTSGYLTEINFIDGLQVDPSLLGETNLATNVWQPKKYTGSYGINGFYLPFSSKISTTSLGFDPNKATEPRDNALVTGSAVLSTAQSKFGGSSLYQPTASESPVGFRTGVSAAQDFLFTKDFTVEGWVYPVSGPDRSFYVSHDGSTYFAFNYSMTANAFNLYLNSGGPSVTSFTFSSQWYHFALSRSGTGSNNLKLFVNGNIVFQTTNNSNLGYANPTLNRIGGGAGSDPQYVDDFRIYNGVGKYTTTFTPSASALPIGIEDPYWSSAVLAVPADGSNNSTTIPTYSGNYLSPVNFSVSAGAGNDALLDSPTDTDTIDTGLGGEVVGNYCTLNLADTNSPLTLTNGGLQFADAGSDGWNIFKGTMGVTSGKWYWEVVPTAINVVFCVSVASAEAAVDTLPGQTQNYGVTLYNSGALYKESSGPVTTLTGYGNNDNVGVALDMDSGKVWFSVNGTWVGGGVPAAGTNAQSTTLKNYSSIWMPAVGTFYANSSGIINFGQRAFTYTAPTGFKALCTANLPTPSIIRPETAFETVLYAGNSNAAYSVSGLNFSPDFVWIKNRTLGTVGTSDHMIFDSIRGAQNYIKTNSTDLQASGSNFLTAFTSDGFTPGTSTRTNETGSNYAAWVWDAGSTTTTNNSGSVTSNVRVNQTAGFSVVQYNTGSNANTYTVGHGLGAIPRFIMIKGGYTTDQLNWDIYHAEYSPTQRLILNSNTDLQNTGGPWDDQRPSSTVIYQDNLNNGWYGQNRNNIAYCFTDIPGYSRFGKWTNNNNNNGTFVNIGFKPKMIFLKNTDNVESWYLLDSKRHTINVSPPDGKNVQPSTANSEGANGASTATIDFLSNGFKIRTTNPSSGEISYGTRNYIFAAFAESPFKYAKAR